MEKSTYNKSLIFIIVAIASTGGLLFGFDTGVISGALPFLERSWDLSTEDQEWIVTALLIGAILGAMSSGRLTDIFGRKKIIVITSFIFAVGSIMAGAAPSMNFLALSRIVLGIAIGISSFTVPMYIAEISPTKIRGALVSAFQLMITIGIVASYFSDQAFADESNPFSWRWMFYVGVIPAIILFVGMIFLPESPRWLMGVGKRDQGIKVLRKVESPDMVEASIKRIDDEIKKEKEAVTNWTELFKPWLRNALIIAIGIMLVQQFVGINTIIYYAPTVFLIAGFEGARAAIAATIIVGVVNVLSTVISMSVIDKIGRRKLYFIGLTGMAIALAALGVFFLNREGMGDAMRYLIVGCILVYIFFFAISLGPLGWLMISEVFPLKVRGLGMSIGSLSNWLFNALVAFTFLKIAWAFTGPGMEIIKEKVDADLTTDQTQILEQYDIPLGSELSAVVDVVSRDDIPEKDMEAIQAAYDVKPNPAGSFFLYAGIAVLGILWGLKYIPETKGVSLEEIEEHWRKGGKPNELT
ncbi:MAG TPA: sugar porter family MFS transporter [Cyclobacteriaceae bacterium]